MNYKNPQRYKNGDLQSMIVWSNKHNLSVLKN